MVGLVNVEYPRFGEIVIKGVRFDHDVIVESGRARRRRKGPSKAYRDRFGHTPLSADEEIPWSAPTLVIGTGADGRLPVMQEVRDLAEAGVRRRALAVAGALLEHLRVEGLGELEVVEAERYLGLEGGSVAPLRVCPGGEVVLRDAEPAPQLAQKLEGRDAVARLDAGDVGRRTAGEGQLALAQPGRLSGCAETLAYRVGVVDVS